MYTNVMRRTFTSPEIDITINHNRLKRYGNKFYLPDGAEFELEFTNHTQDAYLAKIKLNGKYISNSGLILYPGTHEYLERYLDTKRKFKFDTYIVSDTKSNRQAISNNGLVEIEFYKEYYPSYNTTFTNSGTVDATWTNTNQFDSIKINSTIYTNNIKNITCDNIIPLEHKSKLIETGRVEPGSDSTQKFEYIDKQFNYYTERVVTYYLLPDSQKPILTKVRTYCTECGRVVKKGWKYCAGCGKKM